MKIPEMPEWKGVLTRKQAIQILDRAMEHDDPFWENLVQDHYDEKTDTMPTIFHVFSALGISPDEYRAAVGQERAIEGGIGGWEKP